MSSVIILNETPAEIDQIFDGRKRYIYRKTKVSEKSTSIYLNCLEAGNLIVGEIQNQRDFDPIPRRVMGQDESPFGDEPRRVLHFL
jgi:hypothetical protein